MKDRHEYDKSERCFVFYLSILFLKCITFNINFSCFNLLV